MTRGTRSALLAASAILVLIAAAFLASRCEPERGPVLATLRAARGAGVRRDYRERVEQWQQASEGARFVLGDGLSTDASSTAKLALADSSELEVTTSTTLRFLLDEASAQQPSLVLKTGQLVFRAGAHGATLHTHVGVAVLTRGGEVMLRLEPDGLLYAVRLGELRFRDPSQAEQVVRAGERVVVALGMAVLRKQVPDASTPTVADAAVPVPPEPAEEAALSATEADGELQPPVPYFHLRVRAGESFVVHASELPVSVRFEIGALCAGKALIELTGRVLREGEGAINVLFPAGVRGYTVRCSGENARRTSPGARGRVQVLRDPGTRKLPKAPPTSLVEADGRTYTVYYQNQPPAVRVLWPNAPAAPRYDVEVDKKRSSSDSPEYLLASGALADGTHRVTFSAAGRRSRTAVVEVAFDNAAATASLSAPVERGFQPGERVRVSGVALPMWTASVEAGTIESDREHRFAGEAVTSVENPHVAVRLTHPRFGTHYYLRRAAGAP